MYPYITSTIGTEWTGYALQKKKEEATEEQEEEVEATLQDGYEVEATQRVANGFENSMPCFV